MSDNLLRQYLQQQVGVPPHLVEQAAAYFKKETLAKGSYLVRQGGYCKKLILLRSGYLRCYFLKEAREVTHWVFWEGQVVSDLSSFVLNDVAKWSYQAIQDCEAFVLTQPEYERINRELPEWQRYEKHLMIKLIASLENRIYSFISMSSSERYDFLFKVHPEIFNQIPLKYIASMLHMSSETLSRIRSKENS